MKTLAQRLAEKIRLPEEPNGCWEWTGGDNGKGYGRLMFARKTQGAHTWLYEMFVGPVPKGLTLDHICRNRSCVNPAHLEPVTRGENVLRGAGVTAANARKTHCVAGHEFTEENTYRRPHGRECRACYLSRHRKNPKRKAA